MGKFLKILMFTGACLAISALPAHMLIEPVYDNLASRVFWVGLVLTLVCLGLRTILKIMRGEV